MTVHSAMTYKQKPNTIDSLAIYEVLVQADTPDYVPNACTISLQTATGKLPATMLEKKKTQIQLKEGVRAEARPCPNGSLAETVPGTSAFRTREKDIKGKGRKRVAER